MSSDVQRAETAMFGAGCFWGVEHAFMQTEGVLTTEVGYAGGDVPNPTYEQVCTDTTGHAEVVRLTFDPERIGYEGLLKVFFECHDPTQKNRQGPDVGRQYRSVVYYYNESQRRAAEDAIAALNAKGSLPRPVATELEPAPEFYRAEEYHQRYFEKNGVGGCAL